MEDTYYLMVEQQTGGRHLRPLDEYTSPGLMVAEAADHEAGDFPGRWVGALKLSFDTPGRLIAALPVADRAAAVCAELASLSEWRQHQAVPDRWPAGSSSTRTQS